MAPFSQFAPLSPLLPLQMNHYQHYYFLIGSIVANRYELQLSPIEFMAQLSPLTPVNRHCRHWHHWYNWRHWNSKWSIYSEWWTSPTIGSIESIIIDPMAANGDRHWRPLDGTQPLANRNYILFFTKFSVLAIGLFLIIKKCQAIASYRWLILIKRIRAARVKLTSLALIIKLDKRGFTFELDFEPLSNRFCQRVNDIYRTLHRHKV